MLYTEISLIKTLEKSHFLTSRPTASRYVPPGSDFVNETQI